MAELTISYLESLSTGELIELADKYGLDIPLGLERVFIIEELFYLGSEAEDAQDDSGHGDINRGDIEHHEGYSEFKELTILPRQYHIAFVEVLIRDPLWAFVFWEIKAYDRDLHENADDFNGFCLRVIPLKEDDLTPGTAATSAAAPNTAVSFIVALGADDNARYLCFPPEDGRCFKVELCRLNGEHCTVLAESRPFRMPRLIEPKHDSFIRSVYGNPFAQMSGVDHFSLVRSENRLIRPRSIEE